jgi:flagellar hook-associated protein 3 FlgL
MRITSGLLTDNFLQTLNQIQNRKFNQEIKLTTLKNITTLSDDPKKVINIKQLQTLISKNKQYQSNLDSAYAELTVAHDQLQAFSDKAQVIRQLSIDATQTGSSANTSSIGVYIRGVLEDMVKDLNTSFNGKYVFAGTKTTDDSMPPVDPTKTSFPFEIVTETPTADNPSGLRVAFKGNFKERSVNKDANSTEVVNVTADKIFGGDGSQVFEPIVKLYNLTVFNKDGSKRSNTDYFTKADVQELSKYQGLIAQNYDTINNGISQIGAKINRIDTIQAQMKEEYTRLSAFKSLDEDADVAETAMKLAKEQSVLQYTLQSGSKILTQSLFDFLS